MNSVPLYSSTSVWLPSLLLVEMGCDCLLAAVNTVVMGVTWKFFQAPVFDSQDLVILCLTFWRSVKLFSTVDVFLRFPQAMPRSFQFPHSGYSVVPRCGSDLYVPSGQCCETSLHVLLGYLYIYFGK